HVDSTVLIPGLRPFVSIKKMLALINFKFSFQIQIPREELGLTKKIKINKPTKYMNSLFEIKIKINTKQIKELEPNYFQFIFQSKEDLQQVISGTNWSFENQYLILSEWRHKLHSKHLCFQELNLWVQVMNIPLNWLCTEVGVKISKVFKEVHNVVVDNFGNHGGKFLRLLVSLDPNEPIPRCTKVRLGDDVVTIGFRYEKLKNLCHYCGCIGHLDKGCSKKVKDIKACTVKEGQYGDWLKAPDGQFWSSINNHASGSRSPPSSPGRPHSPPSSEHTLHHQSVQQDSASQANQRNQLIIHPVDSNPAFKSSANGSSSSSPGDILKSPGISKPTALGEQPQINSMEIEPSDLPIVLASATSIPDKGKGQFSMLAAVWNYRGLGGPSTVSQIRETIRSHHPIFTFLFETKKSFAFVKTVVRRLGFEDRFSVVDPQGLRGGLLLLWNNSVNIINLVSSSFFIAVHFQLPSSEPQWGVFVYLSTCKIQRASQWELLESKSRKWGSHWFIEGDWNDLCSNSEKKGGNSRSESSFLEFKAFINAIEMEDIKMEGYQFTWCNNRGADNVVEEKLDRAFGSIEWMQNFPNAKTLNLVTSSSDHSLLLLDPGIKKDRRARRFQFDARWIGQAGLNEVVTQAWKIPVSGTPFFQLKEKIKQTSVPLLRWSSQFQTQNQHQIATLTKKLEDLREDNSSAKWDEWSTTRTDLDKAHHYEAMYWQQTSRLHWLKHGDSNSKFFHAYTLHRRRMNAITRLINSRGEELTCQKDIQSHIADFYRSLFSTEAGVDQAGVLLDLLNRYRMFTGQTVNLVKSVIFFSRNTPEFLQRSICAALQGIQSHKSTRYLGLPLGIGKSKKEIFDYL
ncbi:Unknown protein, partial [Striga hermonthica]